MTSLEGSGFELNPNIDLRSTAGLGADYEASTVAYKLYEKGAVPNDEILLKDLAQVLEAYEATLSRPTPSASLHSVLAAFSESLSTSGLRFGTKHDETVRSFLASLITKPLVILTGLSGSGKTQMLAERMAAGVAAGVYQVEHMAAVTFTRKAASELRGRFHLALERELVMACAASPARGGIEDEPQYG